MNSSYHLIILIAALFALTASGLWACESGSDSRRDEGSSDADADADGDGDADADGDGDADADGDGDADADADDECYEQLDVVFVLDVSTSMGSCLSVLRDEIGIVWEAALELDGDPHFGLVVFVDDYLVANDGQPYASAEEIQTDFQSWYQHTSTNKQTQSNASNTDWPENTLDALYGAATEYAWRDADTTLRAIIHVTDDTFREHPEYFTSGIQTMTTYDQVVSTLQQQMIRVASFAAQLGGPAGDIDVKPGFFIDYNDQTPIPQATSGQVFDIDGVCQGSSDISLTAAINDFVIEEFCSPYEIE